MERVTTPLKLIQLLPKTEIKKSAKYWGMDKGVRKLDSFKLISTLTLSHVFQVSSLREIEGYFGVKKSTLADALVSKPLGFFEDLIRLVLTQIKDKTNSRDEKKTVDSLLALDSTTCIVSSSLKKYKLWKLGDVAGLKLHAVWAVGDNWIEDFRITGQRTNDIRAAKLFEIQKKNDLCI